MNWHQVWEVASAPDNVPIVALLFLVPFYCWYAFRQAFANDRLIDKLARRAEVVEYQCRFRWEPHSVAFWDNRATQHYAASDYWPARRVMERVTIVGDRPR